MKKDAYHFSCLQPQTQYPAQIRQILLQTKQLNPLTRVWHFAQKKDSLFLT